MSLMPGFDTRSAAQVAAQVAQEDIALRAQNIQQEQFEAGLIQRDQELAIQAFQAQQAHQIRRMEQQRLAQQSAREAGMRQLQLAIDTGIKFDPASKQYRPLSEEDAEFNPWRERQAERKAKLPLSPDAQIELAKQKTIATETAKEPFRAAAAKRRGAQTAKEFKRETLRRFDERRENAKQRAAMFEKELIARDLHDTRKAEEQVELAKARKWATEEAIKLKYRLEAPERAAKRAERKQSAAEKANQSAYFKAQAAYERAAGSVLRAVKSREEADKKLWKDFVKRFSTAPWFSANFTPGREDIQPGGKLYDEWNRLLIVQNQAVARAQERLKTAKKDADLARDKYLGIAEPQAAQLPAVPPKDVMRSLIAKHKGDLKAAKAEWLESRKAQ